jgi:hypothetical protein
VQVLLRASSARSLSAETVCQMTAKDSSCQVTLVTCGPHALRLWASPREPNRPQQSLTAMLTRWEAEHGSFFLGYGLRLARESIPVTNRYAAVGTKHTKFWRIRMNFVFCFEEAAHSKHHLTD